MGTIVNITPTEGFQQAGSVERSYVYLRTF